MRLHPTRATFQVAVAGAALVVVGVAAKVAPAIAFGGAMLLAVAIGRALALFSVTRIRTSGFEMVWKTPLGKTTLVRDREIVLEGELRNRGFDDVRGVNLRPVASSMLAVQVSPSIVDLPAASTVAFTMKVTGRRVGQWGIHGIALEVRGTPLGGEGLYEVPLMFANPHGVEVLPRPLASLLGSARGGRARLASEAGRPSKRRGEGDHLRELRDLTPGDSFRRIAWKPSARRGKLLVRAMEHEQRDIVWLVLDASVELWSGVPGTAPLDAGVDEIATLAAKHLALGNRVGLVVFASKVRTWLPPESGSPQATHIAAALASAASTADAYRSELDEREVAQRVAEHLRPLDPRGLLDLPRGDLDGLARRAEALRPRAPFTPPVPEAGSERERHLRHYLASFGIELAPRIDDERPRAQTELANIFERLSHEKKNRPSIVHVFSPPPNPEGKLEAALGHLRKARIEVRWTMPDFEPSLVAGAPEGARATVPEAVRDAVLYRTEASELRGARTLRRLGVRARPIRARQAQAMVKR